MPGLMLSVSAAKQENWSSIVVLGLSIPIRVSHPNSTQSLGPDRLASSSPLVSATLTVSQVRVSAFQVHLELSIHFVPVSSFHISGIEHLISLIPPA
jgi:hypothetical protein